MGGYIIATDDPLAPDVQVLLARHVALARELTPATYSHALAPTALLAEDVSFFSVRAVDGGTLLGVGALRQVDVTHGEIKSMHTAAAARRRGVGRAMVEHLLDVARARGYRRVSLETGTGPSFAAAQAFYVAAGFERCGPFGGYTASPHSCFMTRELIPPSGGQTSR